MRAFSRTSAMSSSRILPATVRSLRVGYDETDRSRPQRFQTLGNGYGSRMTEPTVSHTPSGSDPTLGALVHDLTTQVPELIRSEIRLAQAEVAEKGKRAGIGIGMFSGAGLLAFFGLAP